MLEGETVFSSLSAESHTARKQALAAAVGH